MNTNPIEELAAGWQRELPDLDTGPMVTVAGLNRLTALLNQHIREALTSHGSSLADFDVLSALRRSGRPYELMPSELSRRVMLSPSGMTHRLDQLEAAGLVTRRLDPSNRRSLPVALTNVGAETAERLVQLVVTVETEALQALNAGSRSALDGAVETLLKDLDEHRI